MHLVACQYGCDEPGCDFGGDAKNGMGIAAQHQQKYGHSTWVDAIYHHQYGAGGEQA
ncbi:hypothetical protein [Haladaptatus sp. DYF46]|uniref:hypothetical protein n=1 Tax=Haladaptatus sp. DYF46 TaxID=2886041 RepID=UPI001E4B3251|nr:hypothetical protein [Haladaptatus sp. DYF46]